MSLINVPDGNGSWTTIQDFPIEPSPAVAQSIQAQSGDTFLTISVRLFGSVRRWRDIAVLNPQVAFPLDDLSNQFIRVPVE